MVRKDLLDKLDRQILAELQKDARASNRAIARRLNVSAPTVSQRIRRMEDVGLIRGYRVDVAVPEEAPAISAPTGLRCAECRGAIHGPARTRRFHGRSYAFCCSTCESRFEEKAKRVGDATKTLGAAFILLGWVGTFGTLTATCFGMGACSIVPTATAPKIDPCPLWVRPREVLASFVPPHADLMVSMDYGFVGGPSPHPLADRHPPTG